VKSELQKLHFCDNVERKSWALVVSAKISSPSNVTLSCACCGCISVRMRGSTWEAPLLEDDPPSWAENSSTARENPRGVINGLFAPADTARLSSCASAASPPYIRSLIVSCISRRWNVCRSGECNDWLRSESHSDPDTRQELHCRGSCLFDGAQERQKIRPHLRQWCFRTSTLNVLWHSALLQLWHSASGCQQESGNDAALRDLLQSEDWALGLVLYALWNHARLVQSGFGNRSSEKWPFNICVYIHVLSLLILFVFFEPAETPLSTPRNTWWLEESSRHSYRHFQTSTTSSLPITTTSQVQPPTSVISELHEKKVFVLTLFIFKAPNYVLARTLTERVV